MTNVILSQIKYCIVTGKSPRGNFLHSVIYYNGEMIHDPYLNGSGVIDIIDTIILEKV